MEEQFNITLNIYKEEKNKIISKINEFIGDFEEKQNLFKELLYLDEMIEKYNLKISKGKSNLDNNLIYPIEKNTTDNQIKENNKSKEDKSKKIKKNNSNSNSKEKKNKKNNKKKIYKNNESDSNSEDYEIIKKGTKRKKF